MTKEQIFADKLKAFAVAASDLEDAWDNIDGNEEAMKAIDAEYPFKQNLYYNAFSNVRRWASRTANNIEKKM